jgi:DNA-binding XRE family transcriptional regulator
MRLLDLTALLHLLNDPYVIWMILANVVIAIISFFRPRMYLHRPPADTHISRVLRSIRHKLGWTIEEAAEKLDVDVSTYHRWELKRQSPRQESMSKLSTIYGLDANELDLKPAKRRPRLHPLRPDL